MKPSFPSVQQLIELAAKDPQALERLREDHINALIDSAPLHAQRRLRGLQFQIDCKRQVHSSPMGACVSLSQMMLESLHQLNDALQGNPVGSSQRQTKAPVLEFPKAAN